MKKKTLKELREVKKVVSNTETVKGGDREYATELGE
jgi:hypothetical protein